MPSLTLTRDAVLDGALRFKIAGSGYDAGKVIQMLAVYNDNTAAAASGTPFSTKVISVKTTGLGAIPDDTLFTVDGLTNGEKYSVKVMYGSVNSEVVDVSPCAKPATPVVSVIQKEEDKITLEIDLINRFGGNYDDVTLFVKKVSDNTIQTFSLGGMTFTKDTTRAQMKKTYDLLAAVLNDKSSLFEVCAVAYSLDTGYSEPSATVVVRNSDLLDAVLNKVAVQSMDAPDYGSKVTVTFDPNADLLANFVDRVNDGSGNLMSMSLRSSLTKYVVKLTVGASVQTVNVIPEFTEGSIDASGVVTLAALKPLKAVFTIPDALRNNLTANAAYSIESQCAQSANNDGFLFNKVTGSVTLAGRIGVSNSMPTIDLQLSPVASSSDIMLKAKLYFASAFARTAWMRVNRDASADELVTNARFVNLDDVSDKWDIASVNVGFISDVSGSSVNNAIEFSRQFTKAEYELLNKNGKKVGLFLQSVTSNGLVSTGFTDTGVFKFIELPGTIASVSAEAAGTASAPLIRVQWSRGADDMGAVITGYRISLRKSVTTGVGANAVTSWSEPLAYPNLVSVGGALEQNYNSDTLGDAFIPASTYDFVVQGVYSNRNGASNAVMYSAGVSDTATYLTHVVKSVTPVIVYDNTSALSKATISIPDRLVANVIIAGFAQAHPERIDVSGNTERLTTIIADNAALSNPSTLSKSGGAGTAAVTELLGLTPGATVRRWFRQSFTITSGNVTYSYAGPTQEIVIRPVRNIELTEAAVKYTYQPMVSATNPVTFVVTYTAQGARVDFGSIGDAINGLTNPLMSDIRTEFRSKITLNGSVLTNWSSIAIPKVATPALMSASYKTNTSFVVAGTSTNAAAVDGLTSVFTITYANVYQAAIVMVSGDNGGAILPIPNAAALTTGF